MIVLGEAWGMEVLKGIGKLFLNPLLYWAFLLLFFSGLRRTRKERTNFGIKIAGNFSEIKGTGYIAVIVGIVLSGLCIGLGIVFSYETLILLSIVSILLSLSLRFTMLSPSYTIGLTVILLLFMPTIIDNQSYLASDLFRESNLVGLALLMGIFLLVESFLMQRVKRGETYPDLVLGERGKWIGLHHIKKLSIIPFFTLVPSGLITPFADYWPYITLDGQTYSLLLFPFLLGFDHSVKSVLPIKAAEGIGKKVGLLGFIVLLLGIGSIYYWGLAVFAVVFGILGREFISYKHRVRDSGMQSFFGGKSRGLSVIAIIPNTPAERLDIKIGETISKVNGRPLADIDDFYQSLQKSGAFFKLEVLDLAGEPRLLQSALYQNDHHELGLVFVREQYRPKKKLLKQHSN